MVRRSISTWGYLTVEKVFALFGAIRLIILVSQSSNLEPQGLMSSQRPLVRVCSRACESLFGARAGFGTIGSASHDMWSDYIPSLRMEVVICAHMHIQVYIGVNMHVYTDIYIDIHTYT